MIGLLLLYFIGKAFYELADNFDKNKWLFAILGIVTYYAGTFIGGIIMGVIGLIANSNYVEEMPNVAISLLCMPVGLLFCWIFYIIMKNQWKKAAVLDKSNSLDSNLI